MSRNNKNARLHREAKEMGKNRQAGNPGPKQTTPCHGKKRAWWQLGTYSSFINGKGKRDRAQEQQQEVADTPTTTA